MEAQRRDKRQTDWFWMNKSLVDNYGSQIGAIGLAVYAILARCANDEGHAFPSVRYIARLLDLSTNTVIKHLRTLQKHRLITITLRRDPAGDRDTTEYVLLTPPIIDTTGKGVSGNETPIEQKPLSSANNRNSRKVVSQQVRHGVSINNTPEHAEVSQEMRHGVSASETPEVGGVSQMVNGGVSAGETFVAQENKTKTQDKDLTHTPTLLPQPTDMGVGVEIGQDTTAVLFNQPAKDDAKTVLAHLNAVTGCGFQDLGEIPNCLAAGGTVEECILVIDWWDARWTKSNPRQRQYFDTNTPFAVKNFDRYRGKAKKWESEGRPAWVAEDDAAPVTYVSRDQVRQDAVFSNMPSLKERAMAHDHRRHGQVLPSPEDARSLLPRHTD